MMRSARSGPQAVIDESHRALAEFVRGNSGVMKALFSSREDVCLGNPFGPFVRGRKAVDATADRAAAHYRDGEVVGFEAVSTYVAGDLACYVEVERYRARIGGGPELSPVALRVTTVLRLEEGEWKIAHRHADPITTGRPAGSVVQTQS
jgi:ketosteroid isomerase-like protein